MVPNHNISNMTAIAINLVISIALVAIKVVATFFLLFGFIELSDRCSTKRLLKGQAKRK
jgi:hypothetical protein